MDKQDYLGSQFECLRCIERKASYANNGMLVNYLPKKENFTAYTDYVRALCELETAVTRALSALNTFVSLEILTKSVSIWGEDE